MIASSRTGNLLNLFSKPLKGVSVSSHTSSISHHRHSTRQFSSLSLSSSSSTLSYCGNRSNIRLLPSQTVSFYNHHHRYMTSNNNNNQPIVHNPPKRDMSRDNRLIWVDLEMTGLDITKDRIMEIACIVTDDNLQVIEAGPDLCVYIDDAALDGMGKWCKEHHGDSGLTQRCRESKISIQEAEKIMVEFLAKHVHKGMCPLAGNTVHEDKKFLLKEMPLFAEYLHYRIVDVSTIKELARRWYPNVMEKAPVKRYLHRSLADIEDSIEEMKFYQKHIFIPKDEYRDMDNIKHIILVLSGKGGVGKSTVASQLALYLSYTGKKVGLLDVDLCGPSAPKMLGLEDREVHKSSAGWIPVYLDNTRNLGVISIQFLLGDKDAPVIWRGPKKNSMIKQFVSDVCWGELDYLIVDTPPGTSDEHLAVTEELLKYNPDGAIMVTTPQGVSVNDVRKEISFCQKIGLKIIGIVENMSGYVCPHCSECTNIFSSDGGRLLAEQCSLPFLGKIPIDPYLTACSEKGINYFKEYPNSSTLMALKTLCESFESSTSNNNNTDIASDLAKQTMQRTISSRSIEERWKNSSRTSATMMPDGAGFDDDRSSFKDYSSTATSPSIEELDENYLRHRMKRVKDERVVLNVGGRKFETYKSTFASQPNSLLGVMFSDRNRHFLQPSIPSTSESNAGEFFFDRSSQLFEYVLDLYRNGGAVAWPYDPSLRAQLRAELDFFQLPSSMLLGESIIGVETLGERLKRESLARARLEVGDTLARIKAHIIECLQRAAESGKDNEIIQFKSQYEWRSRDHTDEFEFYSFVSNLRNRELLLYDLINENLDVSFQEEFSSSHHSYLLQFVLWNRYTRNGDTPQTDQVEFRQKIAQLSDILYTNNLKK
ncbi:nucleotide binding protein 1-like protein [Cavenderia fasciculata]|uniref:Cytosolic Fe-S cluster assembly factor NUBP2 homolog n=1 Tax=Cavenderia fasciculata TaxID=261658 RepID=F4PUM3_CACFS|nr:nucleotide binding protein 1-like protein [Cavenderia fasciculata]EGG21887.1 nucleotide binding protein 1-like protein [Cavenderia fasciculata]|eukprot:XP_004359738.1 nucleotide binding protein 1-like protein [Cavenderia fasciculata]